MTLGSLSHLCLTVRDLSVSVAFYDRIMAFLGYRRSETRDDYVEWDGPAGWFILRPALAGAADRVHDRTSPGLHHLAWRAADRTEVDALAGLLRTMGAVIESGPADQPDYGKGYYAVFFLDPDGIKLELAHTPGGRVNNSWRSIAPVTLSPGSVKAQRQAMAGSHDLRRLERDARRGETFQTTCRETDWPAAGP